MALWKVEKIITTPPPPGAEFPQDLAIHYIERDSGTRKVTHEAAAEFSLVDLETRICADATALSLTPNDFDCA
jgi:hypothetical protein